MRSNKQSKIRIPKSGFKRSRFNWSHDVNTTFSWGEIQPTQCKMLIPGSKTTLSTQSLIRLAPMVAPTFGRVKYKTYNQFVAMSEVFPNFDAMMAQEPKSTGYGTRTPQKIPSVKLGILCANILHGARATLYFADSASDAAAGKYWTDYRTAPNIVPNTTDPTCSNWATCFARVSGLANEPFYSVVSSDAFGHASNTVMPEAHGMSINLSSFGSGYENVFGTGAVWPVILGAQGPQDYCPVRKSYPGYTVGGTPLPIADYQQEVTFESADYVLEGVYEYSSGNFQYFALAVELSDFGKRLRKILQGCGYQIDFQSNQSVSILPLLAQYKAYFDIFGLELYQGWETTYCAQLIRDIENRFLTDVSSRFERVSGAALATIDNSNNGLAFMLIELANEWYTEEADYISAHMSQLMVTPGVDTSEFISIDSNGDLQFGANVNTNAAQVGDNYTTYDSQFNQQTLNPSNPSKETNIQSSEASNGVGFINQLQHGQVDAELLKRMYKWCNRNTILGRKIAELLRAQGLGKYVDECKSNYIGSSETMITISDVVSTAATDDAALGEYGGKGLQYDASGTLVFENDEYGYWVTLSTVVPEAGYTQGIDPTLTSLDKFNLYNADFDAVGMELTPKMNVVACNFICDPAQGPVGTQGFGFIPRYSKFKVCNNLTNGDFNRHGKRNTYLPYTLDKQLNVNDYSVEGNVYNETSLTSRISNSVLLDKTVKVEDMPIAGNVWRMPTKYNWLGNFDRIFLRVGEHDDADININTAGKSSNEPGDAVGFTDYNDDNFLGHHIYDLQTYAPMKPIEDSYGLDDMDDPIGKAGSEFVHKA